MMKCKVPILCMAVLFVSILAVADDKKPTKAVTPENRPDKWWSDRHAEKLKQLKSQESVDLLMIGDSITHGWEGRGKQVWAEFYAKRNAFNIGYGGDRTEHVIWRLQHGEVEGISPKLAVIMIGTNNTGHRQDPPEQTAAGIKKILAELKKPGRDPRSDFVAPAFRDDVHEVDDLEVGMVLEGLVTNVTNFGAFVDIGVHQDGLVHISELADRFIRSPHEAVQAGQRVQVKVLEVDAARKRISLSTKQAQ